jgi:hypothetical protein
MDKGASNKTVEMMLETFANDNLPRLFSSGE